MKELPLDHIAIAVPAIAEALPLFQRITGGEASAVEHVPAQSVDVAFIGSGPGRLELIQPTDPASGVARFLATRGPELHHLCYRVPELQRALDDLAAAGIRLIDREPRAGAHGHRVAFLHPRSTGGVLIELLEG
jgi:methylmalonyl-CoA/ethylmalonyl-CoA epimerase